MFKHQRGFAAVWLVAAIVAVAVLAVVGYVALKKRGSPGGVLTNLAVKESDFDFIADANVRKHFVAQLNQQTYRYHSESSGKGGRTTYELQTKGDDFNYRTLEQLDGKEVSDLISIGNTVYVKDYSDGKYWKQTIPPEEIKTDDAIESQEPENLASEFKKPNVKYTLLGKESCGKLTCFKYEEADPESELGKRTFWFDDKKYLLRKEVFAFLEFTLTNSYEYDGIAIKAPSQTKDVPPGKSVYDYYFPQGEQSTGEPSQQDVEQAQKQLEAIQTPAPDESDTEP